MQMCPVCERVYDESEYCKCPYCHPYLQWKSSNQGVIICCRKGAKVRVTKAPKTVRFDR